MNYLEWHCTFDYWFFLQVFATCLVIIFASCGSQLPMWYPMVSPSDILVLVYLPLTWYQGWSVQLGK